MLNNLLDYVPDGVFTVDAEWRVTFFNRAAEQITGIKGAEAVGRRCCDVFRASICENACALKQTLAARRPIVILTSGAGLGRREARRRGLGTAQVPNGRKTAEPLPVQPCGCF
jgi:PAS domain-containing protein